MTDKTGVEAWVALNLEAALPGVAVRVSDDGSRNAMHDLDLYREGHVFGTCEVTAAADEAAIEFWNIANGRRSDHWTEAGLSRRLAGRSASQCSVQSAAPGVA